MNTFEQLRKAARDKRDREIKQSRQDYNNIIRKIAELETQLVGSRIRPKSKMDNGTLPDIIFHAAPAERPFSIEDACGFIRAADPDRKFTKASVNTTVNRMKNEGVLKHIATAKGKNQVALYALATANCESNLKTMVDWAKEVEGWKSMSAVELMVRMVENGYDMESPPRSAVAKLKAKLGSLAEHQAP